MARAYTGHVRTALLPVFLGSCLLSSVALADIPPPTGTRRVGFEFTVEGLDAFPERVVFAYPCSATNGVPMREVAVLAPGKRISVGTRGGDCVLYSAAKGTFDAWFATYTPTHTTSDPAADQFVASAAIVRCQGGPTIRNTRPSGESSEPVREVLRATRVDAGGCVVTSVSGPPPSPTPAKGGCAGCAVPARGVGLAGACLGALAVGALALRRGAAKRGRRR